jgi:hypothetical protein
MTPRLRRASRATALAATRAPADATAALARATRGPTEAAR